MSEREKFGREIDVATAEREVDEWLLKQVVVAVPYPAPSPRTLTLALGRRPTLTRALALDPNPRPGQATNASSKTSGADIAAGVLGR